VGGTASVLAGPTVLCRRLIASTERRAESEWKSIATMAWLEAADCVKGRAFGSPHARGLYPQACSAEVDPRAKPGAMAAGKLRFYQSVLYGPT